MQGIQDRWCGPRLIPGAELDSESQDSRCAAGMRTSSGHERSSLCASGSNRRADLRATIQASHGTVGASWVQVCLFVFA